MTVTALIFAGGTETTRAADVPDASLVIAADSGLQNARALGCDVDLVVGDFDSVDPRLLAEAEAGGAALQQHPTAKDKTDLALALDAALVRGVDRVVILGGAGGRLDHLVANVLLLTSDEYRDLEIEARIGAAQVLVVRRETTLHGTPGDLVSLLPAGGTVTGITTSGLRYALNGENLSPGTSRGVSNELASPTAVVRVGRGTLLVIKPDDGR